MSDHNRRARADWAQFEAAGRDLTARARALGLERETLAGQVEPLKLALEGGSIEYKRTLLLEAFRAIEDARYRSLTSAQILGIARQFAIFTFVSTLQRLLADGTIVVRDRPANERTAEPTEEEPEADVKTIIAEIQERVQHEPELRTRQPVKNILMQLSRYSRELEQFKEVTARTPADKRGGMAVNFRQTTDEIFASIRRNYEQLVQADRDAIASAPQHILLRLPVKKMAGLLLREARAGMEVRSGLLFAREEQSGTRELLLELAENRAPMLELIDEEARVSLEIAGTERIANQLSLAFARELEKRIERETEVY